MAPAHHLIYENIRFALLAASALGQESARPLVEQLRRGVMAGSCTAFSPLAAWLGYSRGYTSIMRPSLTHSSRQTAQEILDELRPLGSDGYKRVIFNHGIKEPCFGVKISELQKIRKRIKKDYQLALDLYDTGNYDAMYLAGLIADDERMTKKDLQHWAEKAYCRAISGAIVATVAAGSKHGWELGLEWIDSDEELIASAGWGTLASLVSIKGDAELALAELKRLLQCVQKQIHSAPDTVRYQMNSFIIAVGSYVQPLTESALEIGEKIGRVAADMGNTSCEVPFAPDSIRKVQKRGTIGKKRKSAKC